VQIAASGKRFVGSMITGAGQSYGVLVELF
jgi:hypothetical protein